MNAKMTQKDLVIRVYKSESTVRMWELGKSEPDLATVTLLSEIFSVSADTILGENKNPTDEIVLTDGEREWLELYRSMTEDEREIFLRRFGGEK